MKGKVSLVCGNSWKMLHDTRFKEHFELAGDFNQHFGLFKGVGKVFHMPVQTSGAVVVIHVVEVKLICRLSNLRVV